MKYIITSLIIWFIAINTYSQFVVSEYFDTGNPSAEWTEILVISDMSWIVGCSIRDNSNSASWQEAIIFKDIPLWKDLREGTIIVINHRGSTNYDTDKSDGYIEVSAGSSEVFSNPIIEADASSLNLNSNHDMIQILDPAGNNLHTLAHMLPTRENEVFAGILGKKIGFPGTPITSVRVYPGNIDSDYNQGLNGSFTLGSGNSSKGRANNALTGVATNSFYWWENRMPKWTGSISPMNTSITPDYKGIKLEWTAASSITDKNEGYLIVRYVDNGNTPINLVDGKIYGPGDKVGPYTIIDTLPDLTNKTYTDNFKIGAFNCGEKYSYRVYIYRYQKSNIPSDASTYDVDPKNGRGRAYNKTDFASSAKAIEKEVPTKPVISSLDNRTKFCSKEIVEIYSDIRNTDKYYYEWYFDDTFLGINDFKITVTKSGTYKLVIKNKLSGCSDSNTVNIEFISAPESFILNKADNKTFAKDTIIEVCGTEEFNFQGIVVPSTPDYFWLKDGVKINDKINTIKITESGVYKFVAIASGLCPDTSITIDIRYANPDFTLNPTSLNFDFDTAPELDFTIFNKSDKELIIGPDNITINPSTNFIIINPIITNQNPLKIAPNSSSIVKLRFQTTDYEKKNAVLTIDVCNFEQKINLEGIRKNSGRSVLQAEPPTGINFGKIIYQCNEMYEKKINVIVNGPKPLKTTLKKMTKNLFFPSSSTLIEDTEVTLNENSTHEINIKISPTLVSGNYSDEIIIIFKNESDSKYDTLKIPISAEIIDPKFLPETIKFDFSELPTCNNIIDTSFTLEINPGYEFVINNNFSNPQVSLAESLPLKLNANGTNKINTKFNFTSTDDIFTEIELTPCGKKIPIQIIPPKRELQISFVDTLDFGIVNNSEFCGDFAQNIIINSSHPVSIELIEYMNDPLILEIFEKQQLKQGDNKILALFTFQKVGKYLDSVVFFLKECNKKITVYMKGERIDTKLFRLSDEIIDFGSDYVGVSEIFKTKLYNYSKTEILEVSSIDVPNPFILIKPSVSNFPIRVKPLDSFDLEFQYSRDATGNYNDSLSLNIALPCARTLKYEINGSAIDRKDYKLSYKMPDSYSAFINESFTLPIELEMSANFNQTDASIENIKMYFNYDRAIFDIKSLKPISNKLILNNSNFQPGNIFLDYKLSETTNLQNGLLFELEVKTLLGHTLKSSIRLDSVVYLAKSAIETPTDSTIITLNGDCFIQFRTVEVGGNASMILNGSNPLNNLIDIDINIVSDEITKLSLIDLQGNIVRDLINQNLKPGNYNVQFNAELLTNGTYFIILRNGINTEKLKVMISK